jgi:hypothetical protein
MMAGPARIARFIEARADGTIVEAFAARDVTIIENFAPHLFVGEDAVARWAAGMRQHLQGTDGLRHAFGPACDFASGGGEVFFTLPTRWEGVARGKRFSENGGWAFLLVHDQGTWRVKAYAWAVTDLSLDAT